MTKPRVLPLLAFLIVICGTRGASAQTDSISVERKIAGLAQFWQEANYNFAFFHLNPDLDWDAEFESAIARVIATGSDRDYIRELQRFAALLGEAHTNVDAGRAFREKHGGHPALELEEIERRAVVMNTSKELGDEIPIGSVITKVDGVSVDEVLEHSVFPYMSASTTPYLWRRSIRGHPWRAVGLLFGDVGSTVRLEIETPDGSLREVSVDRLAGNAEVAWKRMPRKDVEPLEFRRMEDGIVYVALNTFNTTDVVTAFEEHLDEIESARGVVLDVRENGGGSSSNGWNIGRYFSDVRLEGSHWRTRTHVAAFKAWGKFSSDPERKLYYEMNAWYEPEEFTVVEVPDRTFDVPVAILMGPSTYSAAEDFLAFMRAVPQVVFVGGRSAGSTGQPLTFPVPGGAWAGITSKHDTMPDGTEFVGVGVMPDVEVYQTVEAFRSGEDPVLERALALLKRKLR